MRRDRGGELAELAAQEQRDRGDDGEGKAHGRGDRGDRADIEPAQGAGYGGEREGDQDGKAQRHEDRTADIERDDGRRRDQGGRELQPGRLRGSSVLLGHSGGTHAHAPLVTGEVYSADLYRF